MEIKVLASGSSGSAYYVSGDGAPLLLDAGIPFQAIQRGLGFGASGVAGCLVSHEHGDHSRAVPELIKRGVDCYMSEGTAAAIGIHGTCHRVIPVKAREVFFLDTWNILPFEIEHDGAEPLGFLLASKAGGKLLYATDTAYLKYKFAGLTHLMIECNYALDILRENVAGGDVPLAHKNRVMRSHMSLETLCGFLKANDLSKVEEIYLLHLSDGNSDAEGFKRRVQEISGKVVRVA